MSSKLFRYLFIFLFFVTACKKDPVNEIVNPLDNCTMLNGSMSWNFDGSSYCANSSLLAAKSTALTLNGITLTGVTLTLQLDSIVPGTYGMTSTTNSIIFTDQIGNAWTAVDSNPGSLTVTKNDTTLNRFEANFNCNVKSPITGVTKQISGGSIKVYYIE